MNIEQKRLSSNNLQSPQTFIQKKL